MFHILKRQVCKILHQYQKRLNQVKNIIDNVDIGFKIIIYKQLKIEIMLYKLM